jgi:AAA domain
MSAPAVARMLGDPVDLLTLDTSKPRPWTRGARGITRPGLRTIRFGARGSGKSIAELILAVQVCEAGGSVLYADWENGARRTAERLAAILADRPPATRAAVAERFDYRPNPRLGRLASTTAIDEWAALFAGRDLAVIDSTARALAQLGLDENAAADFARFMSSYVDPIASQGVAVDLLDNTGWAESDRTRGSSAKLDMCELAYRVTSTDIAPDRHGTITLDRVRSRDGDETRQLVTHVGDGTYTPLHPPPVSERQAAIVEAILSYVEQNPGSTTEEVAKGIGIRKTECRSQLADLETPRTGSGTVSQRPSQTRDRRGTPHTRNGWYLASQSQLATVPQPRTDTDRQYTADTGGPGPTTLKSGTGTPPAGPAHPQNGHDHPHNCTPEAPATTEHGGTA